MYTHVSPIIQFVVPCNLFGSVRIQYEILQELLTHITNMYTLPLEHWLLCQFHFNIIAILPSSYNDLYVYFNLLFMEHVLYVLITYAYKTDTCIRTYFLV